MTGRSRLPTMAGLLGIPDEPPAPQVEETAPLRRLNPVEWAENFRLEETGEAIELAPHQAAILRYVFKRDDRGRFPYQTIVYSTPKKSGKTTIGGLITQWAAETWGNFQEVLCIGNDAQQAKDRAFARMRHSIEQSPGYDRGRQALPGRWKLLEKEAAFVNGSKVRAIATDYQGEAGANPSLTVWTELWGFIHKADLRFWAEMAPSPTRVNSVRFIETYAGFEGESELLWGLYESTVLNGRQLTAGELGDLSAFEEAPNPDSLIPCWVNDAAGIFTYWDSGWVAHRMPWQKGGDGERYYAHEAGTQTPSQFDRLHLNLWVSAESSFVPMEWWDACNKGPLPLLGGDLTPVVLSLDAAVSGDSFGLVAVTRDPENTADGVRIRYVQKWDPPAGGAIDYAGPEAEVRRLCAAYNVVQIAYDPYQLHDMATRLTRDGVAWCREFKQGEERLIADKLLQDLIVHQRIKHDGDPDLRQHVANANAKISKDSDTRLRITKKSESRKIDLIVAVSMASAECLRLSL